MKLSAVTQFFLLCALALGIILGGWVVPGLAERWAGKDSPATEEIEIPEWERPALVPRDVPFAASVRAEGFIEHMARTIAVPVLEAGVVKEVKVDPRQAVRKGQPLVRLDDSKVRSRHQAAQAHVAQTEALLKQARIRETELAERYERVRELVAMEAASAAELDKFSYQLRLCRAEIEELKARRKVQLAQLKEVALMLERHELRSPAKGKVWVLPYAPGTYLEPGQGYPSLVIAPDSPLALRVLVHEEELPRLSDRARAVAFLPGEGEEGQMLRLAYERTEPEVMLVERPNASPLRYAQVLYRLVDEDVKLLVGQRVIVYLEAEAVSSRAENWTPGAS